VAITETTGFSDPYFNTGGFSKVTLVTSPLFDYHPITTVSGTGGDPVTDGALTGVAPEEVAAATYGKVIPIVIGGAPRIGGFIIYGPKYRTESDIVYCSFGVSFGLQCNPDGERELWEVRMDGVKVWTVEDGSLLSGLPDNLDNDFMEGTEDQDPHALLVADYGAAAPSFRSQCCLFFEDLPLTSFDNHVPFVSAVIADVTDGADPTDGILLGDALEALAATPYVGLSSDEFVTSGITARIDALIDAERSSFMDLLLRLARLLPLDVVQTDKLRVIERSSIEPDIVLTPGRILAAPEAISVGRVQETDVAQELEFIYIDIDRDYEFVPQPARRPTAPIALTSSRSKETIRLPLVTTASEAISWVTLRKYWDEVSREQIAFTALPYGMEIEPGAMVEVVTDLKTWVVRITETLHEARGTVRCAGTPVLRCSLSNIDEGTDIGEQTIAIYFRGGATATSGTTITIPNIDFGPYESSRVIAVAFSFGATLARSISSVSIGGSSGTLAVDSNGGGAFVVGSAIYYAQPSGTTGQTVSVTFSGGVQAFALAIYRMTPGTATPYDTNSAGGSGTTFTIPIDVADGGAVIETARSQSGSVLSASYDGVDSLTVDINASIVSQFAQSHATTTETATRNIGYSSPLSTSKVIAAASWV